MSSGRKSTAYINVGIFAALLLVCLFAPSCARRAATRAFEEFRAPIDALPSHLRDLQVFWGLRSNTKTDLIEAGRDLARMNAAYRLKVMENDSLVAELKRYRSLLGMPAEGMFRMEVARVARRDMNGWWQQLIIRKGSSSGIRPGDAVVYSGGVVGRIKSVGLSESVVELVSSVDFRMAAHFAGDSRPVIYQGAGERSFHQASGLVTDVHSDISASAASPRRLVTSSLAGTFPEGLTIGTVSELRLDPDGMFKSGAVQLASDLSAVEEVSVLVRVEGVPPGGR